MAFIDRLKYLELTARVSVLHGGDKEVSVSVGLRKLSA